MRETSRRAIPRTGAAADATRQRDLRARSTSRVTPRVTRGERAQGVNASGTVRHVSEAPSVKLTGGLTHEKRRDCAEASASFSTEKRGP